MSSPNTRVPTSTIRAADAVEVLRSALAQAAAVPLADDVVAQLAVLTLRSIADKARQHDGTLQATLSAANEELTPTDVAISVAALLDAADLELFELAMWKSLGRP